MKASKSLVSLWTLATLAVSANAAVITVTSSNAVVVVGQTNLTQAIQLLQNGDVIRFNIPGSAGQVIYIPTPPNGYPIITNDNVTVDGDSQGGASPNTNPIHAANNAKLKICLDSRNGNATQMDYITNYIAEPSRPGYGDDEWAVIGVFGGTNVHIKGLAILSSPLGIDGNATIKSISFARSYDRSCANWHVSGCWIGVDPATGQVGYLDDGVTVATPGIAIASYRHRDPQDPPDGRPAVYPQPGTIGVAAGSTTPRAEFNVIVTGYGFDAEGLNYRFSGNFWGVLPDGMTSADMSLLNDGAQMGDGFIEVGRNTSNLIIGTDGDGVNDADEGNVFGGIATGSAPMMDLYSDPQTNNVIAGNYFGVAVDGVTVFANAATLIDGFGNQATVQFGSDFNGVSDALEANVVYDNYPTGSPDVTYPRMIELSTGTVLSLRGNKLVNNFTPPVDPTQAGGEFMPDYYAKAVADTNMSVVPTLSSNSTTARLIGTVPLPNTNYPVVLVDVYIPDPAGITNGIAFDAVNFPDGFVQGKTYLGSFIADGSGDLDVTPGVFAFDISSLNVPAGTLLTVTANYAKVLVGNPGTDTVTTLFSVPVPLKQGPSAPIISSATRNGANLVITWSGGSAPYVVQTRDNLNNGTWGSAAGATIVGTTATVPITGSQGYYRIQSQ